MIRDALLEMTLFEAKKETENKLRWDVDVNGTRFELYIPKWRVPQPWPSRIWVAVFERRETAEEPGNLRREQVEADPSLRHEPIVATVVRYKEPEHTIRFRPIGEREEWEIGEPYIPNVLVPNDAARLRILVLWDIESRGEFVAPR